MVEGKVNVGGRGSHPGRRTVLSSTAAAFPVTWEDPSDANYHWMFERMHAPEPMTLADAVTFQCAFDHGVTFAAQLYGVPLRAITRRVNTFLYLALVPTDAPGQHAEARLTQAISRL